MGGNLRLGRTDEGDIMSRQVWKFPLEVTDSQCIQMPTDAEILCVQMQAGQPCLWAQVDPQAEKGPRYIWIVGTGHELPDFVMRYIGTFQMHQGALVFHVFEVLL